MKKLLQFDIVGLLVYLMQLSLIVPSIVLVEPLPNWLKEEFATPNFVNVGTFIVVTTLVWVVLATVVGIAFAFHGGVRSSNSRSLASSKEEKPH